MDQVKVGKYISQKRKELGLTQKELAEIIEVTDKSVSKWERGNGLPDVTRLKPLCDALKVSLNELIAGEDISESVLSQKMEENIMSLVKENESQRRNGKSLYFVGAIIAALAVCMLGASLQGSSIRAVKWYFDIPSLLFLALFIGIGVMLGKDKSKKGIWDMIRKMSIPAGVFIALFQAVLILGTLSTVETLGPSLAVCILPLLYAVVIYVIATIVKSHLD